MSTREMTFNDEKNTEKILTTRSSKLVTTTPYYSKPPRIVCKLCERAIFLWQTIRRLRDDWESIDGCHEPKEVIAYLGGSLTQLYEVISDIYYHASSNDYFESDINIRKDKNGKFEVYNVKTFEVIYPEIYQGKEEEND